MPKGRVEKIDIDTESLKRIRIFNALKTYFNSIDSDIVNISTVGTLGTKSAIKTAAKGLGIDDTIANFIASMVPSERGTDWTLDQCRYGDENHAKIGQFNAQMTSYPRLWDLSKRIEGLITNLSVHASGVAVINGDINEYTSLMRTNKGIFVTCWTLDDSEATGLLKYDLLTVQALDKIRTTLNLLLEDGEIQWEGSLKQTYDKHLDPSTALDYHSSYVWDAISSGHVNDLFQFDSNIGSRAIKLIQPRSLTDLAAGNSVMRLMSEDKVQPLDLFVRNKNNLSHWYNDMRNKGLNDAEIELMEKYLKLTYGIAASQEVVMRMVMDPRIGGFTVAEANSLRKGIAKKKQKDIDASKELLFANKEKTNASDNLLSYVWNDQIGMSLGYGFSDLHTVAYSTIAIQQANLITKFPPVYWNCACLTVNASAVNEEDYENLLDEDIIELTEEEDKNTKSKVDYGKIVSAIDAIKDTISVTPPDINVSRFGFVPNKQTNTIAYGLKGIARVGDQVIANIIRLRPFTSLIDFVERMKDGKTTLISKDRVVNLIKAGAFDSLEQKPREEIMDSYLHYLVPRRTNLNLNNFLMLIRNKLTPQELVETVGTYLFTRSARKNRDTAKTIYRLGGEDDSLCRWYRKWVGEPSWDAEGAYIVSAVWDGYYDAAMNTARHWIKSNMEELIDALHRVEIAEMRAKYADGDLLQWELDGLNFYHSGHPLVDTILPVQTTPIGEIEDSKVEGQFIIKGNVIPRYKIYSIKGVVLVRDKPKHMIVFSTPEGVVKVNIYKQSFAKYDKTVLDGAGEVLQSSFLEKGNRLVISGIMRDNVFFPKVYKATGLDAVMRIENGDEGYYLEAKK